MCTKTRILIIFCLFFTVACGSSGGLIFNGATAPADGSDGSTPAASGYETPISSIPLPRVVDDSRVLSFANDSETKNPLIGSAGAVATSDTTESVSSLQVMVSEVALSVDSVCGDVNSVCFPVNADGSFEAFVSLTDQSVTHVYWGVADSTGALQEIVDTAGVAIASNEVAETIQTNLLFTINAPSSVGVAGDAAYALANSSGIKIGANATSGALEVMGDYLSAYLDFEADGTKLAYSETDSLVGVMSDTAGVQMLDYTRDAVTDTAETATDANALSYTFMRPINDILYYGFEQASSTQAYLMYATTEEKWTEDHKQIWILPELDTGEDSDSTSAVIHHTKTLAYDSTQIAAFTWTVVIFEDGTDIRTRLIYENGRYSTDRFDGNVWKTTSDVNIKDLVVYYDNDYNRINFAMLDNTNAKVWLGQYVTTGTRIISDSRAVLVGSNPVAMTYSADSGKLYVLNQGGQSVSVIPLMSDATTPIATAVVSDTINLADSVAGKTITFVPNSILLNANTLLIGDETTKAIVLVDVSAYE